MIYTATIRITSVAVSTLQIPMADNQQKHCSVHLLVFRSILIKFSPIYFMRYFRNGFIMESDLLLYHSSSLLTFHQYQNVAVIFDFKTD